MAKQQKSNCVKLTTLAFDYFNRKEKMKSLETKLAILKNDFTLEADDVFNKEGFMELIVRNPTPDNKVQELPFLIIKKSQRATIKFDIQKLEKSLSKEMATKVINKDYSVNDILGLANYVKECGGDQKIFKSFLTITKSVDVKTLERLEGIGKIDSDVVKDCCSVVLGDATYNVTKSGRQETYGEEC